MGNGIAQVAARAGYSVIMHDVREEFLERGLKTIDKSLQRDVEKERLDAAGKQGVIASYIHPGAQLGVLIEVNCESDFVARTDDFQELVHDLAMQVAAADPQFIRKEDVTQAALDKEKDIQRGRALGEGKPEKMVDKIVEGRMNKYYEEVCLYEQPFIKENTTSIADVIKAKIAKLGENISVSRFVRFKVGDALSGENPAAETPAAG